MAYGTINADLMTTSDGVSSSGLYGFKNRIINGAMVIDQRNAGASVANAGQYTLDRWAAFGSSTSKFNIQQNAGSVTPPVGFTNYLGVTSTAATSLGASDEYEIFQKIEGYNFADLGWGTANAKTVTLSFWVRSSLTGTFGGTVTNAGYSYAYPFSYTISSANTWEQKSITIVGPTGGSNFGTTNGVGIYLHFSLGAGSTVSGTGGSWVSTYYASVTGATSVVGTNGATFYITGVQLEVGSKATSFDWRPYGTELQLCQRYYFRAVTGDAQAISMGGYYTSSDMRTVTYFPVPMRIAPSVVSATGTDYFRMQVNGGNDTFTTLLDGGPKTPTTIMLYNNLDMSGTAGQSGFVYSNSASASLAFNAEL